MNERRIAWESQFVCRRHLLRLTSLLLVAVVLLLTACNSNNNNTPDAQHLIKSAQQAIQKVTAYHFNLQAQNIDLSGKLPITSADGDVKVPDRLKATATIQGNAVQIIAIGNQSYINLFGGWQTTTGLIDPRTLSDPKTGVSAILGHIQNPGQPTDSSVNGTSCWLIPGKLDPTLLAGITGGGAPAGTLDNVSVCIGKADNLPYQIIIDGPAAQGDTSKTTRTITLSKFNETITIEPPTGTSIV
jgi:LppX_LprAFG lipoprotein